MGTSTFFEVSTSALVFMMGYVWAVISQRYLYKSILSFLIGVLGVLIGTVIIGFVVFLLDGLSVWWMMRMFIFILTFFLTGLLLNVFHPRKKVENIESEVVSEGV